MHLRWRSARWSGVLPLATILFVATPVSVGAQPDAGIAVADSLVRAKCGTCHAADARGRLQRLSWARATPEGWQAAVQRMVRENDVSLTPPEARAIVKYLSAQHGLAPAEARPMMYSAERRVRDETTALDATLVDTCGRCHEAARALSWRRTADGWQQFVERHATRYRFTSDPRTIAHLGEIAPFASREWTEWRARTPQPAPVGRWLVTARVPGRGSFHGEMHVDPAGGDDEFRTRLRLQSVTDATVVTRSGRSVVYGGTAWRGRSQGTSAVTTGPDDLASEARETMWVAADGARAEGRWFWGQYEELGFDVAMRRPSSDATLLLVDPSSFRTGATAGRLRLIGDRFPLPVTAADITLGAGVAVRRIVSARPGEIVAEVDVAADAVPGPRSVAVRTSTGSATLEGAVAIYDRVDYVKVAPESSLATFGSRTYARGVQQFEAIGYQRGADGRPHTTDDLAVGPVPAAWSMEVFYETDPGTQARVGTISPTGFFTPADADPGTNFDVWIVATARTEKGQDGRPLTGKGYLVVTVPTYTFDGRTFVRELGRWIEEGGGAR